MLLLLLCRENSNKTRLRFEENDKNKSQSWHTIINKRLRLYKKKTSKPNATS